MRKSQRIAELEQELYDYKKRYEEFAKTGVSKERYDRAVDSATRQMERRVSVEKELADILDLLDIAGYLPEMLLERRWVDGVGDHISLRVEALRAYIILKQEQEDATR